MHSIANPSKLTTGVWPVVVVAATIVSTFALLIAMRSPGGWILLAGFALVPFLWAIVRHPQLLIASSIFLLFTNAPVVAFKFHGLPRMVALLGLPAVLMTIWMYQLVVRRETFAFPMAWRWALVFLGVEVFSAVICRYPDIAIDVLKTHMIEGMGLFLIICNLVRTRKSLQQSVIALLVAGALLGGLSVLQQITSTHGNDYGGFAQVPMEGRGFETGDLQRQRRSAGPLGEQNRYAQNLLMLFPLAVLPISAVGGTWRKAGYASAAILVAAGCILTFSRGAAVAFVMLLVVMKVTGYIRTRYLMFLSAGALLLLLAFPQLVSRMDSLGTLVGYLNGDHGAQTEGLDGAITGRATSMLSAARVTVDYPLLGVGPGNFPLYNREYAKVGGFRDQEEDREAHCLYLHIAAEFGLLGLALFLAMIGSTLLSLHRVRQSHREHDPVMSGLASGFAMAILAYLLTGLFLHFSFVRFFWMILALANCVPLIVAREAAESTDARETSNAWQIREIRSTGMVV